MAAKKRKPLAREGEPTQRIPTGLEIPIPNGRIMSEMPLAYRMN